jgi:hypothetical protein
MIFESPSLLSGITASPGQLFPLGEMLSGLSISFGQLATMPFIYSGNSASPGQKIENSLPRYAPDIFKLIFGENATQSSTQLTINKPDLTGLTPLANNTAESLLVAIIAKNINPQVLKIQTPKIDIEFWGCGYNNNKRIDTLLIKAYNLLLTTNTYEIADSNNTINPNDY